MPFFSKPRYSTVAPPRKKDIPKDLYTRCPKSGEIVYTRELEKNLKVVPKSGYHFPLESQKRIDSLVDEGSWTEHDAQVRPVDPLNFVATSNYTDKLAADERRSGLPEGVVCGLGQIEGLPLSLAVMDFRFIMGSMGAVVGEKITRAIERAVDEKIPVVIVSASGGARMHEGAYSLMQMAKTSAALGRLHEAGLPYISVLTHPTTGGVTASFATLGDVILAEPGALICFAGPRVIKETTKQDLPAGFQTSEFLLEKGLVDQIVTRHEMRPTIARLLRAFYRAPRNRKSA